jgi:hypothetical protein
MTRSQFLGVRREDGANFLCFQVILKKPLNSYPPQNGIFSIKLSFADCTLLARKNEMT